CTRAPPSYYYESGYYGYFEFW
nr:immunoglobulin heavy chain junction region [Macaca mulatta]